ncbi:NAD(P)-binding protein [Cryphonectria parasitica EP155]|uniref:NAD(P)-binding protein n=1 Tax=Cryphonectria parasitica (strain ATCC 38755 / EP155) TaxID=660469 RepID=A0A9P4XQJ2_CRYP1|nr:NAD(P)-binding protein [Cryphonectria parasitica EP155]KAF3759907.1 NAD(P)-binding protein [Cryphonectria parasitica EP155]
MIQQGIFGTSLPVIASHEGAGTVVAGGASVEDWKGSRVMCGLPFHSCGKCLDCTGPTESWRQYCIRVEGHCGVHRNGFFSEYAVCDARSTTRLPNEISFLSAAPLACAGRTSWRGVEQAGLAPGQWLAIVGSGGGLGHLGVQFAKKKGLKVVGIDARDDGLEISRTMGADLVVDARKGKDAVVKQIQEAVGGTGTDATVTLSDAPSAAALGCAVTKMHGTMVQIAQPAEVVIPFQELVMRDIRVHGSVVSSPQESENMVHFIAENGVSVKTNVFDGLDKIETLLEKVHSGKMQGKAVIVVDQDQIKKEKELGAKY